MWGAGKGVEDRNKGGGDVRAIHQARETQPVLPAPKAADREEEEGKLEEQLAGDDGLEPLGRAGHEEISKLFGVPGEEVFAGLGVEGGGDSLGVDQEGDGDVGGEVEEEDPPQQGGHATGAVAAAGGGHASWSCRLWFCVCKWEAL